MKYFIDFEFYDREDVRKAPLFISVGVCSLDGREYYAESDYALARCDEDNWLTENVKPYLTGEGIDESMISKELEKFMVDPEEIWAWYGAYDYVCFCKLWGRMINLPEQFPMYFHEIQQVHGGRGSNKLPKQSSVEHHALNDAKYVRECYNKLVLGE